VFQDNEETNSAVRRANVIIQNLMKRLGVARSYVPTKLFSGQRQESDTRTEQGESIRDNGDHTSSSQQPSLQTVDANLDSFEVNEIIHMFTEEQKLPSTSHDGVSPHNRLLRNFC
jgi:hypothetical protein